MKPGIWLSVLSITLCAGLFSNKSYALSSDEMVTCAGTDNLDEVFAKKIGINIEMIKNASDYLKVEQAFENLIVDLGKESKTCDEWLSKSKAAAAKLNSISTETVELFGARK
ncbi:MAG TPA: hypothetical protein VN132_14160 [Bdellovibrio sp.]|nr:hypothetical protein [Bdellovibrio sp.]